MRTIGLSLVMLFFIGCTSELPLDLLIVNGTVYDGSGAESIKATIGIRGDRIVGIGDLTNKTAKRVIDAQGLVVAPGFIDLHAHLEPIFELSDCESHVRQGVTTSLGGPDGRGPLPFAQYVDSLKQLGVGMNVGFLVGHNSVRSEVMKLDNRKPTPAELDRMKQLVVGAILPALHLLDVMYKFLPFSKPLLKVQPAPLGRKNSRVSILSP